MKKVKKVIGEFFVILIVLVLYLNLASAMTVLINIPERYSEVEAGQKVYFEIEVKWPENIGRKDLRMEYTLKNKDNQTIAYLKVLKAIQTQASFLDSISVPESTKSGVYTIFLTLTDYKDLNQEVAASFRVVEKQTDKRLLYTSIVVIAFILISVIFIFSYKKLKILIEKFKVRMKVDEIIKKRKH
ncbi:MAG: hypothetical protein NUV46_00020 [Nanoarchaeota archaeon]|nr:hypothetical protein [Nanoarchaeota archaeon]